MGVFKEPFQVRFRAIEFEHSCCHRGQNEPSHPDSFLRSINQIILATEGLEFHASIQSPANSYQMNLDFDHAWGTLLIRSGIWQEKPFDASTLTEIPDIQPDFLLTNDSEILAVEIEKSNKKTIWFDLIKLMMLIGGGIVQFGLIVAPRNYAHRMGVWDLFESARFYKYCLQKYAKTELDLIKNIAVLGYTQEVRVSGNWAELRRESINEIKNKAKHYFSP